MPKLTEAQWDALKRAQRFSSLTVGQCNWGTTIHPQTAAKLVREGLMLGDSRFSYFVALTDAGHKALAEKGAGDRG